MYIKLHIVILGLIANQVEFTQSSKYVTRRNRGNDATNPGASTSYSSEPNKDTNSHNPEVQNPLNVQNVQNVKNVRSVLNSSPVQFPFLNFPDVLQSPYQAYLNYLNKMSQKDDQEELEEVTRRNSSSLLPFLQPNDVHRGDYDDPNRVADNVCTRTCVRGQNKICYYQFTFENYPTLGAACTDCLQNITSCFAKGCVTADGVERSMLTNNRMMPSPSIQVCAGDTLVVDLKNKLLGRSTTIHWHGHRQVKTPYNDGVPLVTQCPINECEVFRYVMDTDVPGTHFYHPHDGLEKVDGITGAFIVRQPKDEDPNGALYDFDLPSHVIVINDWFHQVADSLFPGNRFNNTEQVPHTYVINGRGIYFENGERVSNVPISIFHVTRGNRYLFHIVAGTCFECQYEFTIEGHDMTIIGADVQSSQPARVNALVMSPGERYSVVVNAYQRINSYWIHVRALGLCTHTAARQVAILHYAGASNQPNSPIPRFNVSANANTKTLAVSPVNSKCDSSNSDGICVSKLQSVNRAPRRVVSPKPDVQIHWGFGFHFYTYDTLFNNELYSTYLQSPAPTVGSTINGIINNLPSSPLLTQYNDIAQDAICSPAFLPIEQWSAHRECANVIKLPLNAVVEILIVDTANYDPNGISHAIHLHGYDYYILEQGVFPDGLQFNQSLAWLKTKLSTRTANDIPQFPLRKDTIALTSGGYAVVRIFTDNPGFWFFHCHFAYHLDSGMGGILQVGELDDMVQAPRGFPKCGDFLPYVDV